MKTKDYNLTSLEKFVNEYAQNGWACTDQIFQPEFLRALASEGLALQSAGHFTKACIGHQSSKTQNTSIRGDYTYWLSETVSSETLKTFLQFLQDFKTLLNREFFLGLRVAEAHLAMYPPEANYDKHYDNHRGTSARKITFVLYLNEQWQASHGGQLTLFHPESADEVLQTVEPTLGKFIIFDSALFPHQVEKSHEPRWSLTGWFRDDACI